MTARRTTMMVQELGQRILPSISLVVFPFVGPGPPQRATPGRHSDARLLSRYSTHLARSGLR
jgi:hypothetical protein